MRLHTDLWCDSGSSFRYHDLAAAPGGSRLAGPRLQSAVSICPTQWPEVYYWKSRGGRNSEKNAVLRTGRQRLQQKCVLSPLNNCGGLGTGLAKGGKCCAAVLSTPLGCLDDVRNLTDTARSGSRRFEPVIGDGQPRQLPAQDRHFQGKDIKSADTLVIPNEDDVSQGG